MISPPTGVIAVAAHGSKKESFISTEGALISTKGALRRPMTSDNHPYHPSHPSVHHIALIELNRPKIDLSQPSMT